MAKSLSLEQQKILKEQYGILKAQELADMFNVSINTVYNFAKKLKLTRQLNPVFKLTTEQHQIILGGILGDGNIKKNGSNHYYRECHAIGEKDYLIWKYQKLENITTGKLFDIPGRGYSQQIGFQTKNSSTFTEYANMERIDIIKGLDELGFIIWALDDGWFRSNSKVGCYAISRGSLNDEESNALLIKANQIGLEMHCIGSSQDFSLTSKNNCRLKEITYKYFNKTLDIIEKKINRLKIKTMVDSTPLKNIGKPRV